MAFPTEELVNAWNSEEGRGTMSEIMEWSQVPPGIRQALLAGLGATETTPYRMFAFTTSSDIDELLRDLRVGEPERSLNIGEKRLDQAHVQRSPLRRGNVSSTSGGHSSSDYGASATIAGAHSIIVERRFFKRDGVTSGSESNRVYFGC